MGNQKQCNRLWTLCYKKCKRRRGGRKTERQIQLTVAQVQGQVSEWLSCSLSLSDFAVQRSPCSLRFTCVCCCCCLLHVRELSFSGCRLQFTGAGVLLGGRIAPHATTVSCLLLFFCRLFALMFCKLINSTRTHSAHTRAHTQAHVHHASARFEISKAIYLH